MRARARGARRRAGGGRSYHLLVLGLEQLRDAEEDLGRLEARELLSLRDHPQDAREDADALSRVDLAVVEAAGLLEHRALLQPRKRAVRLVLVLLLTLRHAHSRLPHSLRKPKNKGETERLSEGTAAQRGSRRERTCSHCPACPAISEVDDCAVAMAQ